MKSRWSEVEGGVTAPAGFRACGVPAGIKPNRNDMALLASDVSAVAAGVFTTNRIQAAPVQVCRDHLARGGGAVRAVIVNAGNANACTGEPGLRNAVRMADLTAQRLGVPPESVLVCSTGTIGLPLPMDKVERGIELAVPALSPTGGPDAARAIMTTDTRPKEGALRFKVDGRPVTVAGMAKGAGMICPNMATLLAFLTTDAAVAPEALVLVVRDAVEKSFNRITVDGDRSTNDTVLLLANGVAGNTPLRSGHPDWRVFTAAVTEVARRLAFQIVKDGEGATKFVTIRVAGAPGRRAAERVARAVANSLLVKTSWFGADPNWGRVICAVGYAGVAVDPARIRIDYDGQTVVQGGQPVGFSVDALHAIIVKPEFVIDVDLGLGRSRHEIYTCDCSDRYVAINAAYMT